ncbi:MAG: pyridoxamine 5'-phosphate oxidase [Candidatus Nephthysia bennettiae]|nr:MAG: pyridoxamine 5'-phosphate oxidase [Candidatus Dormibacteraeota bacterium]
MEQRKADVITTMDNNHDVWLATAEPSGRPHLIAVSSWWDGSTITIATTIGSRSARNLDSTGLARVAAGTPDDAITIDATVGDRISVGQADSGIAENFAKAVGWDPREIGEDWAFFPLRPVRIQAYRGYDELEGRDVMRDGRWLV